MSFWELNFISIFDTCAASSPIVCSRLSIFFCKFMTVFAMCFSCIDCSWAFTSQNIEFNWHSLKMVWIDADFISTKMINLKIFRYRTFYKFVSKTICTNDFTMITGAAISSAFSAEPNPAIISFAHAIPKIFWSIFSAHRLNRIFVLVRCQA